MLRGRDSICKQVRRISMRSTLLISINLISSLFVRSLTFLYARPLRCFNSLSPAWLSSSWSRTRACTPKFMDWFSVRAAYFKILNEKWDEERLLTRTLLCVSRAVFCAGAVRHVSVCDEGKSRSGQSIILTENAWNCLFKKSDVQR